MGRYGRVRVVVARWDGIYGRRVLGRYGRLRVAVGWRIVDRGMVVGKE